MIKSTNQDKHSVRYCILDTNIVEYLLNKDINPALTPILGKITQNGRELAISQATIFELIKGANTDKQAKVKEQTEKFVQLKVAKQVLIFAGYLEKVYRSEPSISANFSDIDKIIASTVILETAVFLTADTNDFPRPFFQERKWYELDYVKKKKKITTHICLLQPNLASIKKHLDRIYLQNILS